MLEVRFKRHEMVAIIISKIVFGKLWSTKTVAEPVASPVLGRTIKRRVEKRAQTRQRLEQQSSKTKRCRSRRGQ